MSEANTGRISVPASAAYVIISAGANQIYGVHISNKGKPEYLFDHAVNYVKMKESQILSGGAIGTGLILAPGIFIESNGTWSTNASWGTVIDPLTVEPSTTYYTTIKAAFFVGYFTSDGTFISRAVISNSVFTTPSNCGKVIISAGLNVGYITVSTSPIQLTDNPVYHATTFAELKTAVSKALTERNVTVYIDNDITITNFTRNDLMLGNGIKIIGRPDVKITAHYTGENTDINRYYSVFEVMKEGTPAGNRNHDFSLECVNIDAKNIMYCVHDDVNPNQMGGTHKYNECHMKIDNTENPVWHAHFCIGGGLGDNMLVVIDGCTFESAETNSAAGAAASYHNGFFTTLKAEVHVKNCYFKGLSTFRFSWFGPSSTVSTAYVSNNSLGSELINEAENSSAAIQNAEILGWNNVIRS